MATFHFDLVSPERIAFSGQVEQVDIPGVDGDIGVMAGHAPLVASIRPGIMTVTLGGKRERIIVLGGLAEISAKGLTVLADTAMSVAEVDKFAFASQISEMEEGLKECEGDTLDRAIERLDHFKTIQSQIVSSTAMH